MQLTQKELGTINNSEFLISKNRIISEIETQLKATKTELESLVDNSGKKLNISNEHFKSNISKGENYKNLPFVILDYPSIFQKNDIFAYRTMFWWGNYFSATLHLQGKYLDYYRNKLLSNFSLLLNKDIYICINDSPWEYHFESNNFEMLQPKHLEILEKKNFIKLSKKIPLEDYNSISQFSYDYFSHLLKVLTV